MTNAEQQRPCNLEQTAGRDAIYCHREDMAEREGTIRQLRADFLSEWRQLFPNSPSPPIRALGSLRFDNDDEAGPTPSGVSFDEWLSSGAVTQLGNSLRCTEEKISQLKEQLSRKTYLRNFLLRLLECLGDSGEVQRSRPAPVNNSTYSPALDPSLFSERGENNEKGVTGERKQRPNFGRTESNVVDRNYTPRGDPESGTTKTSEQTTILPRLLTAADLPLTSKSGYGECSGSCQPSTTTRCIVEVTQNTVHGQASTQRVPLPPPPQQHSQTKVKHTFSDPATSVSVVKFVEQDKGSCSSSNSSSRPVRQLQRQRGIDEKCTERKFRACNRANSGTDDSDTRNQDTAAPPPPPVTLVTGPPPRRERNTNPTQPQRHASSPQRGRDDTAITPNDTEAHLGTGKNFHATAEEEIARAAESVTCGTQTEISFSLKEQWVISSTDADNTATMFWNRKKSNAKRPESGETRDRDNSGILGRYSDTPADLPTAPPLLRSDSGSARNVQYLKLTEGFSIVLGADTGGSAPKPAPSSQPPQHHHHQQQQQRRGGQGPHQIRQQDRISDRDEISEEEEEEEEEVYDNNTAKRMAAASEGASGESVSAASNKPQVEPGLDERYENVSHGDAAAAAAGGGGGLEGGGATTATTTAANTRRNPVTNVKSSSPSQSPPTKPRSHAPVSRVSSDTTGFRSASAEANSPPKPSAKPQPHPRKKLPALPPTQQKPSSVFYVQTVTPENPSLVTGPNNTAGGGRRGSGGDGGLEEEEKGEARVTEEEQEVEERWGDSRVDAGEKGARIESGRGGGSASISAAPLRHEAHTRQGRDTRADRRAQSALPFAQCLSPHSPPVEGFVPTTSTQPASTTKKGSGDPEPNKATTPATTFVVVDSAAASPSSFSPAAQHRTESDIRRAFSSFHPTAEQKLKSEPTEKTDSAPSRAARDNTDRGNNSSHASQLGVRELCQASVTGALEISQRLSAFADSANDSGSSSSVSGSGGGDGATTTAATATAAAAQAESLSDQPADNNMLRFNRRTLCTTAGSDLGELPAVYRKTEDTPSVFRGSETQLPQSSPPEHTMLPRHEGKAGTKEGGDGEEEGGGGGEEEATTPTGPQPDSHPAAGVDADADAGGFDGQPRTYHETDLDSEACTLMLRERKPPPPQPPPKPRKKAKESTYENWTINRAVTQFVDSNSSSSDEDDDNDSDSTSPGCTLDRASSTNKGSKDSGLCLDVQPPQASGVVKIMVGGAAQGLFGGDRFQDERISSIEELHRMHDEEDYADYAHLKQQARKDSAAAAEQDDNLSIASDIVFIPGSDVTESSEDHRQAVSHQDNSSQGNRTLSSTSDDEEEQDSPPSVDSSYDDVDGETSMSGSARDNMLKMRYLLVTGVLETEKTYLAILELLIHYKRTLEASCRTSQPVISEEDINSIFSNLQELQNIHKEFVEGLHNKVKNWSPEQTIGDVFKCLVVMFPVFSKYAENYQRAVATIHRCSLESQRFQELAQQIVLTSTTREVTSLEDALFKPVQRLQRNTLVLHDLIKHTPQDHPDFETLTRALNLSQHNLENFGTSLVPGHKVEEKRNLVKSSFLVELVSGWRKLRFIFLFSDVLVCTKREVHRGGKVMFDCKWFIPMNVLKMDTKFAYQDDMKFSKKDEIDDLKKKLRSLKTELKMELKKEPLKEKHWSIGGMASSRTIEKLKKKINELEGQLIMASPKLPFKVWHDTGKVHTMLMTTDYEREEWREVITSLRRKSSRTESVLPSALDVQEMVNSVKELPQVNKIGSVLTETDEEMVYGTLNVTIHKMNGLRSACDTYCCLEMDSYGHFFMKARTHICSNSADPSWNEDFELELEGSQTLRILCYRKGPDKHGDILLGRGALEMSKEWLKGTFQEKTVAMNEFSLVLSVRYTAAEKTMRRTPSKQSTAVFGVKICACAKREGKTVPTIVTACVQEVERRGMDETGIYRVSGVTSDVQKLKKYFDKNVKAGAMNVSDVDIHSVTGVLKLYLRELPEPLFTEASYSNFMDALKLSDAEGKERCMLSLLHNLPDINYYTAVYLLEHLLKVSRSEKDNKMTIHNLSTIFGPTLLAPATKTTGVSLSDMMSLGAEQCMKQSSVIYFLLSLLARGCSLRRSSTPT